MPSRKRPGLVLALAVVIGGCADIRPPSPNTGGNVAWDQSLDEADPPAVLASARTTRPDSASAPGTTPIADASAVAASAYPHRAPVPELAPGAPAMRFAALSDDACMTELRRLGLPFERSAQAASGVATPLRVTGSLHGVRFVAAAAPSPHGIFDCRLALAANALAEALASFGVVQVRVDNTYRPNAHLPGKKTPSQHAHGLAIDLTVLSLADGRTLTIPSDWHAPIGSTPCGPDAVLHEPTREALELRAIVCDVARRGIFHHMLTPSSNGAHRSHFHFDLKRGDTRQYLR